MPELPEVEYAARLARSFVVGRTIERVRVLHPAQRRSLPAAAARRAVGQQITGLERRGKYQALHLANGSTIAVHFRMAGDWELMEPGAPQPRNARAVLYLTGGVALALTDSRALSTIALLPPGESPFPELGPEANSDAFNARWLATWFRTRRGPVKPALLDQRAVAGVGNIYASEALWYARIDPATPVNALTPGQVRRVVNGVKRAIDKAIAGSERYYDRTASRTEPRFNVYDREGKPCRRCGEEIVRIMQAGRSTYFCPRCISR